MTRQLSLTILLLCLLGTAVSADGMVQPAATTDCCGSAPFAGAYIGAALGFARQRTEILNETVGAPAFGLTFKDQEDSVTFGGYVGYNWQRCCSPVVFGVEADFNYLNTSPTALDIEPDLGVGTETTSLKSNIDWFGTLRGRAGFVVHDQLLLYATGGLAYARVDHTLSDDCVGCGTPPAPGINLGTFSQSDKKTKVGWTVGGGVELVHDAHWLLRAEALYVDLGSDGQSYVVVTPAGTGTADTKWDDQFWVARLGVAYKFSAPDCCAAPLK